MIGRCDYCKEPKRIDSRNSLCASCLRQFQEIGNGDFSASQLDALLYLAASAAREGGHIGVTDIAVAAEIRRIDLAAKLREQNRETLSGGAPTRRSRRPSRRRPS
jgi:hypothetical protein